MDKVKPGDIFLHTIRMVEGKVVGYDESVNGPVSEEAKKKMMEGIHAHIRHIKWFLSVHFNTSHAPKTWFDWAGVPVKVERNMAAIGSNGKLHWMVNLPCKVADEVSFEETGEVKKIEDMDPGQLFVLDEEILMMSEDPYICYSMSGLTVTRLPGSRECPVMRLHAKFMMEEKTWTTK